jgi:hypothetical protein
MSREAKGKISALGGSIEGEYKTEFRAPLVLPSCKHHIKEEKSFWKRETWVRIIHGRPDGSNSVKWECKNK